MNEKLPFPTEISTAALRSDMHHLDAKTREIGLAGIAGVRAILASSAPAVPSRQPG
ncbi:MAG: hypothetical protein P8M16_01310 [Acidimicrobiales bacterium]|nr:hypothetical protein [Acidimicrobiales bacterium]